MQSRQSASSAFVISLLIAGSGLYYVGRLRWALILLALFLIDFFLIGLFATPKAVIVGLCVALGLEARLGLPGRLDRLARPPGSEPPGHAWWPTPLRWWSWPVCWWCCGGHCSVTGSTRSLRARWSRRCRSATTSSATRACLAISRWGCGCYRQGNVEGFKRVAGVAGDRLEIVAGELLVNGRNLGLFHAPAEMVRSPYSLSLAPLVANPAMSTCSATGATTAPTAVTSARSQWRM
jgi:signal peptidase I